MILLKIFTKTKNIKKRKKLILITAKRTWTTSWNRKPKILICKADSCLALSWALLTRWSKPRRNLNSLLKLLRKTSSRGRVSSARIVVMRRNLEGPTNRLTCQLCQLSSRKLDWISAPSKVWEKHWSSKWGFSTSLTILRMTNWVVTQLYLKQSTRPSKNSTTIASM